MPGTSKEMRDEKAAERQVRKKDEGYGGETEGNLLNVATKWNGN